MIGVQCKRTDYLTDFIPIFAAKIKKENVSLEDQLKQDNQKVELYLKESLELISSYESEQKKLEKLEEEFEERQKKFNQCLDQLEEINSNNIINELANTVISSDNSYSIEQLFQNDKGIYGATKNQYTKLLFNQQELDKNLQIQQILEQDTQNQVNQIEELIRQMENVKQDYQAKIRSVEKDAIKQSDEQLNSITQQETVNKILSDQKDSVEELEQNFNLRTQDLQSKIQGELSKIESGSENKQKIHVITANDESGSIADNEEDIKFVNKQLTQSIAQLSSEHVVSQILFDDKARLIARKQPAGSLQNLPKFKLGGTNFAPALKIVKELVDITSQDTQIFIFLLTDGDSSASDIKECIKILQNIRKSRNDIQFFAVGFSQAYNKDNLIKLSNAANNNKLSTKLGNIEFEYVNDAANSDELIQVFSTFSRVLDFMAQQKTIDVLRDQLQMEYKQKQQALQFINENAEARMAGAKKQFEMLNQMQGSSIQDKQKAMKDLITNQIQPIEEQLLILRTQKEQLVQRFADAQSCSKDYQKKLNDNKEELQSVEKQMKEQYIQLVELQKQTGETVNQFLIKSGFRSIEEMKMFYNYISSARHVISSEIETVEKTKNLIKQIRDKIDQLRSYLDVKNEQRLKDMIDDAQILQNVAKNFKECLSDDEIKNLDKKTIILNIVKHKNREDYQNYQPYISAIIENLNLKDLALAKSENIKKLTKDIVQEVRPQEKKKKITFDNDIDDDLGKENQSKKGNLNYDIDDETDKYVSVLNLDEEYKLPASMIVLSRDFKSLRLAVKELAESQDKDINKRRQFRARLQFMQSVLDEDEFKQHIKRAIKVIQSIVDEGYSKQHKQQMIKELKLTFSSFQMAAKELEQFNKNVQIHKLESQQDIEKKLEEEQRAYLSLLDDKKKALEIDKDSKNQEKLDK